MPKEEEENRKILIDTIFSSKSFEKLKSRWVMPNGECEIPEEHQEVVIQLLSVLSTAAKEDAIEMDSYNALTNLLRFTFGKKHNSLLQKGNFEEIWVNGGVEEVLDTMEEMLKASDVMQDSKIYEVTRNIKKFVDFAAALNVIEEKEHNELLKFFITTFLYDYQNSNRTS